MVPDQVALCLIVSRGCPVRGDDVNEQRQAPAGVLCAVSLPPPPLPPPPRSSISSQTGGSGFSRITDGSDSAGRPGWSGKQAGAARWHVCGAGGGDASHAWRGAWPGRGSVPPRVGRHVPGLQHTGGERSLYSYPRPSSQLLVASCTGCHVGGMRMLPSQIGTEWRNGNASDSQR